MILKVSIHLQEREPPEEHGTSRQDVHGVFKDALPSLRHKPDQSHAHGFPSNGNRFASDQGSLDAISPLCSNVSCLSSLFPPQVGRWERGSS